MTVQISLEVSNEARTQRNSTASVERGKPMPVNIIPEDCAVCGTEITVYARAAFCGYTAVICLSANCLECQERKAAEKPDSPELRENETVENGGDEPSDVVCAEEETRSHHVYELIDGRDGSVFYVGVTINPDCRFYEHGAPKSPSAAFPRIQEIRQSGNEYQMRIVASFKNRQRAESFEALLISGTPGIVNRAVPPLRSVATV